MTRALRLAIALCALMGSAQAHATLVKEVISPKGIKAWLVEEHSLPVVAMRVSFSGSGFAYDPADRLGRANMTAAMLMEGAGSLNQREFAAALDARAIHMNTGADEDTISLSVESLSEHADEAFSYAAMALADPRFDSDAIDRVRSQTRTALTLQEQQPGYIAERAWVKAAYGDHPYAHPQLGTKDTIGDISGSDLSRVRERFLTRGNMVIGVAGDITPEALGSLLDKYFTALPEKYDPDTKVEETQVAPGGEPTLIDFDIPQTMVLFGAPGVKRNDPNYFAAYVMNHILGGAGSLNSLLGEEIRVSRGLAYSVNSFIEPLDHAASWRGNFASRNDQARQATNVMLASLTAFLQKGPTDQELADAKQYLVDSFMLHLDSNSDLASFLVNMQINHLGIDYLQRRNSLVASVRKDEVLAMAKRLIDPDKLLIVMVGRPALASKAP